jgi:predicted RNase H-like HicB family nuclease
MKSYVFRMVIDPDEDRDDADPPALPGCYSWGYTYEEALRNMKEAAELWGETLAEDGQPIPAPPHDARTSTAPDAACGAAGRSRRSWARHSFGRPPAVARPSIGLAACRS